MKKRQKRIIKIFGILFLFCLGIGLLRYSGYGSIAANSKDATEFKIHFIDVGQGNAALLEMNGHFAIIDGGDADAVGKLTSYLDENGVQKLDYLIATHYDIDHIYGLIRVLYKYEIGEVLSPDYTADTKTYEAFMQALSTHNKTFRQPEVGEQISFEDVQMLCVAPGNTKFQNENDYSLGFKLIYGDTSVLICGDATYRSEIEMLDSGLDLKSDVYMVSHHGSSSSSTTEFLNAVKPTISIISVGADNTYGHPTKKVLKRLAVAGTDIYRTDQLGDIIVFSDGEHLTINCRGGMKTAEAEANGLSGVNYIVNTNSGKFHLEDCDSVKDISEGNKLFYEGEREQLIQMGYTPCKKCNP